MASLSSLIRALISAPLLVAPLLLASLSTPAAAVEEPIGQWPLVPEPEVVEGFDPPSNPYAAGHRGVDLMGETDQAVRTALPGTVSFAGPLAGRGVVVVDHGATRTTYEPVDARVTVGDPVAAGDVIGRLQLPGSHCFPRACLHWGWREGDTYLDPLRLVGAGPVRLLPLWRDSPTAASGPSGVSPPSPPTVSGRGASIGSGAGMGLLEGAA
ncbi:hypothetical protein GCM10027020_01860 [Nocardioides salsibiostraticola]